MQTTTKRIFVFGSNLAGRHGKGAAKFAVENHGAIYGVGYGMQGNSFAIPTKDHHIRTMYIEDINKYVMNFIAYAKAHPELEFQLTPIGCGLAGYKPRVIAPLFKNSPPNVHLPEEFKEILNES